MNILCAHQPYGGNVGLPHPEPPTAIVQTTLTMEQSPPLQFKIILVGNMSVGKTCLHRRFSDQQSPLDVTATYGVDLHYKNMEVDGWNIKLGILDTAGMERFRAITAPFYRGAQGVILVYDITDKSSFDALPGWLAEIDEHVLPTTPKMIVGNKLDQEHFRKVPTSDGESFAARNGALFREASARTLVGVNEVFEDLVRKILHAEDQTKSVDVFRRWPQDEIIRLYAKDKPKRRWRDKCQC
ncbi:P-loop containing nucleoside triphosphate hydrolase protein [Pisolithus marmoratus]|nr:P-loop containing nucleoside triphosphate hydrolase protein [Pisolithus marmoratus]